MRTPPNEHFKRKNHSGSRGSPSQVRIMLLFILCICACAGCSAATPSPAALSTLTPFLMNVDPTNTSSPIPTPAGSQYPTAVPVPIDTDADWSKGPADAPLSLLVYSDFQCPYSAELQMVLKQLEQLHPEDLRIVYRPFPLITGHDNASLAAQIAHEAGVRGAFWEVHDLLFAQQEEWTSLSAQAFLEWAAPTFVSLGLDADALRESIGSGRYARMMEEAHVAGLASGLTGTPMLFINQEFYALAPELAPLEATLRLKKLQLMQYASYPPLIIDLEANYLATIRLPEGEMRLELYAASAPLAVNNFIFLAQEGWYDDQGIYRVLPGVLVESGDPSATGLGGPGYAFEDEIDPDLTFDQPGMLAMSSLGPNANGCRFFINLNPLPNLNGSRTIFGQVLSGLDLLQDLQKRDPMDDLLQAPETKILSIEIEER